MHERHPQILKWEWIAATGVVLAGLACGPLGASPTATPTPAPTATEVPTEVPTQPAQSFQGGSDASPVAATGINASNVVNIQELWSFDVSQTALLATSASPVNHDIATFGGDSIVRIWDGDAASLVLEMPRLANYGFGLAYSPDGSVLASGAGFVVTLWDAATGERLRETIVNADVFRIVWTPDSSALAVVGNNSSRIIVIDPYSGEVVTEIPSPDRLVLWSIAFSPDGRLMATSNVNGNVRVTDIDSGNYVYEDLTIAHGAGWDLEFSPDGSRLASCNGSGGVWIWDTSTWQIDLSGEDVHPGGCTDGVFSRDGSVYFSVGDDGDLNAWDTSTGDLLTYLSAEQAIWTVSITGDGELLGLALDNGTLSVVGLP